MLGDWWWRKIGVLVLFAVVYIFAIYFIIRGVNEITRASDMIWYVWWLVWIVLLIALVTLLVIEFQYIKRWVRYAGTLALLVLSSMISRVYVSEILYVLLVLFLFHLALLVLIIHKQGILDLYRRISTQQLVQTWVRNFAVVIALCLSLMIAHGWKSVDIDCEVLYTFFHKAWDMISLPGWSKDSRSLEQFEDATIADMIWVDTTHIEQVVAQVEDINLEVLLSGDTTEKTSGLVASLETWKRFLTEELVEDKDSINQWFCALVVEHIDKRQRSPLFLYSTAILLFFLLFPLLKLFFRITDGLTYLLIKILFGLGLYKKSKEMGEIEKIH